MEVNFDQIHGQTEFSLPSRPTWSFETSKTDLEAQEQSYFDTWKASIYASTPSDQLSYFEHNLEVWRQLWRVCEMSQVVVIVVDVRHPILHLPPSLYRYISGLGKPMCVALMKTDLVRGEVIEAWKAYILDILPGLHIGCVSIYEGRVVEGGKPKRYTHAAGVEELTQLIEDLCNDPRFTSEWSAFKSHRFHTAEKSPTSAKTDLAEKEYLTIGFVGHPNAGKSSLINSILAKKVVSASKTPGHTKHFQTIHLTPHIRLCDCPGLVFPMRVPKWLQVLSGIYNVAQVKDPYGPLMELGRHVDLNGGLKVGGVGESVFEVCEGVAVQKGFFTAKAARPDIYRAANWILRAVVDGRILLSWKPPGFYAAHPNHLDTCPSPTRLPDDDNDEESLDELGSEPDDVESSKVIAGASGGFFSALRQLDSEEEEDLSEI